MKPRLVELLLLQLLVGCSERHVDGSMTLRFQGVVVDVARNPVEDADMYLYDRKNQQEVLLCRTADEGKCNVSLSYSYSYDESRLLHQPANGASRFEVRVRDDRVDIGTQLLPKLTREQVAGREPVRVHMVVSR